MRNSRKLISAAAMVAMSLAGGRALATDYIWSGNYPVDGNWGSVLNWAPLIFSSPSTSSDRASFIAVSSLRATAELSTGTTTVGTLGVSGQSAVGPYIFQGVGGGETLKVTSAVIIDNSVGASNVTFSGLDVIANVTSIASASTLNIGGSMTYKSSFLQTSGNGVFNVASGNTLNAPVSYSSNGLSSVSGLLQTQGLDITNGGQVSINSTGYLLLQNGATISNGTLAINSGTMTYDLGGVVDVTGSGRVRFTSGHALADLADIRVTSGGMIVADSYLDVGNSVTGTLSVDGSGSSVTALNTSDWGASAAGNASVTFSNFGAGTYSSLRLGLSNGKADVSLLSSSALTTNSSLLVGPNTGTTSLCNISVTNSTLTSNGTSLFQNGGKLTMGTSSAVNFNGDATFATGSTLSQSSGFLTIASGRTLNIAGGVVNKTGGNSALSNGATLRITAGTFTTNSFFDIANGVASGTMIVDGATARFNSTSGITDWGQNPGNFATITLANGGVGTYISGLQIADGGGKALVNINTNAQLFANNLVAGGTASAATINIGGGALNAMNAAQFNNGALVNLTSGGLNLAGNTTFSTGATLTRSGGNIVLAAGQTLAFAGGVGSLSAEYALPSGSTLRVTNGGRFQTVEYLDIGNGGNGTLVVDGTNSRVIAGSTSYWGEGAGSTATVSFANSGAGTFGGIEAARPGASSVITIATNASVTADALTVGGAGSSGSVSISGGSLNVLGSGTFLNGTTVNVSGTGLLRLGGNSTFTTGATFNGNGLNLGNNVTLAFDGGMGTFQISGLEFNNGQSLRITNGGAVNVVGGDCDFSLNPGSSSLLVDGVNSRYSYTSPIGLSWAESPGSIATISFSNGGAGTFTQSFVLGNNGGAAVVNVLSNSLLHAPGFFTNGGAGGGGGSVTINVSGGTLRTTGASNVNGGGTLNYSSGTVEIGGTLGVGIVYPNARVLLTPGGNKVLRVGGLDISVANGGKVDLSNNSMIVDHSGASPIDTIRGYLFTGRNGGNWLGNGLTSSAAAGSLQTALGYVEASSMGSPPTFNGYPIDGTTLLVDYTWYGDANLDGKVNTLDFNNLAGNFGGSSKYWFNGDFNYDGTVNSADFGLLVGSYGNTTAPAAALPGPDLGAVVPEPASCALLGLLPLARRRQTRNQAQ